LISDGWGGIDEAMLEVYGIVPQSCGRGRPPTRPKPGKDWLYLQMIKQRNQHGRLQGVKLKAIWGSEAELVELLGKSTAYIERSNLTTRIFSARLTRKTLAFSKNVQAHENAVTWEDAYYNWVRPHKTLRVEIQDDPTRKWRLRTPAMAAGLTDHIWTVKEHYLPFLYQVLNTLDRETIRFSMNDKFIASRVLRFVFMVLIGGVSNDAKNRSRIFVFA
jgi:hypothetical protein